MVSQRRWWFCKWARALAVLAAPALAQYGGRPVQYHIAATKLTIFLTTANVTVTREAAVRRADLNQHIFDFRKALADPTQDPLPESQALYRVLVAPIAHDLRQAGAKTLMRTLYKEEKEDRVTKAEALRQSQLALLHGTASVAAATHPFFWAPFVLMGNWL